MFSYPHHINDFDNATRHLSRVERSIYRDLIELYYRTESPLPLDISRICKLIIADFNEHSTCVEQTLNEFFHKRLDGWAHVRCELEIDRYKSNNSQKSEAGKASAAKRAEKRQRIINGRSTHVGTDDQRKVNVEATNQLTLNQLTNPIVIPTEIPVVPYKEIVELFNKTFPELPQVQKINAARQKLIKQRWIQNAELQSLESWDKFFRYVRGSDFLMGKTSKPFIGMCFDWMFNSANFTKIYEGNYHGGQQ